MLCLIAFIYGLDNQLVDLFHPEVEYRINSKDTYSNNHGGDHNHHRTVRQFTSGRPRHFVYQFIVRIFEGLSDLAKKLHILRY